MCVCSSVSAHALFVKIPMPQVDIQIYGSTFIYRICMHSFIYDL